VIIKPGVPPRFTAHSSGRLPPCPLCREPLVDGDSVTKLADGELAHSKCEKDKANEKAPVRL
jgi:hypothetical protein